MEKNFDGWNKTKKGIDSKVGRFYHEGEVWWCNLGLNVGYEQNGDNVKFQRPVLIIKALSAKTFFALPLTTSHYEHKYRIDVGFISNKNAKAIISQMRVLDTKRLTEFICLLEKDVLDEIKKTIRKLF